MVHALRSRRVALPEGECDAVVVINGGTIAGVHVGESACAGVPVEDLGEVALLPGLVDTHVHINEPGRTDWEGFRNRNKGRGCRGLHYAGRHAAQLPA